TCGHQDRIAARRQANECRGSITFAELRARKTETFSVEFWMRSDPWLLIASGPVPKQIDADNCADQHIDADIDELGWPMGEIEAADESQSGYRDENQSAVRRIAVVQKIADAA